MLMKNKDKLKVSNRIILFYSKIFKIQIFYSHFDSYFKKIV